MVPRVAVVIRFRTFHWQRRCHFSRCQRRQEVFDHHRSHLIIFATDLHELCQNLTVDDDAVTMGTAHTGTDLG